MNSPFSLRRARPQDLEQLLHIEHTCFTPERQSSRSVFKYSLGSDRQEIWVNPDNNTLQAYLHLWVYAKTIRIYSIAVLPDARGTGLASTLLRFVDERAAANGIIRISLEADAKDSQLIAWYQRHGYEAVKSLNHYYAKNWHGLRLVKTLRNSPK